MIKDFGKFQFDKTIGIRVHSSEDSSHSASRAASGRRSAGQQNFCLESVTRRRVGTVSWERRSLPPRTRAGAHGTLTRAKGVEVFVWLAHGVARRCERSCDTGQGDHACWF